MLIATRALLGVAGATVGPSTLSLIRTMFSDPRQRTTAIGLWISSFSAGAVIGPLVGGVMLEFFWWGSVFLLAVPVMGLLLLLGPRLLPEYRDPESGSIDLISVGQVPQETSRHYPTAEMVTAARRTSHGPTDMLLTPGPSAWFVCRNPNRELRVDHKRMNYEYLGQRKTFSATANLPAKS